MIVSIGEVVWDIFDHRRVLGGAPVNVAYHLHCLRMDVKVISRVGRDALADATLERLASLGLPLEGVQRDDTLPTGRVNVTVDERNEPHFDIVAPAAWDNIALDEAVKLVGDEPFSLVFGTLAQRDSRSRAAIRALWEKASSRFYDVNLRPPFTTRELVLDSLAKANVVKVNGDELAVIAGWAGVGETDPPTVARTLVKNLDLSALAVTEGASGAWVVTGDDFFEDGGSPVTVADTVGAGDAFFAALIEGYASGCSWPETLVRANQRGGYVASQHGATPPMPE